MRIPPAIQLFIITLLLSVAASAQAPYVETVEVRVTNIDVIVTDRAGKPVTGLSKSDFEVLEDGKPQPITNLYEVRGSAAASGETRPAAEPPQELRRRRFVFFLDSFSLGLERNGVINSLRNFIDQQMQAGDEATLVSWNRRMEIIVPFTGEKTALLSGLDVLSKRTAAGATLQADKLRVYQRAMDVYRDNTMIQARGGGARMEQGLANKNIMDRVATFVQQWAEEVRDNQRALYQSLHVMLTSLGGVEGRKIMLFAGTYMPERPGLEVYEMLNRSLPNFEVYVGPAVSRLKSQAEEIQQIARHANAAGVTLYTIFPEPMDNDPTKEGTNFAEFANSAASLQTLSRVTGGTMVAKTWNFDSALRAIASDLGSYYSIGYRSNRDERPGEHSIVVRTRRPEYRVRARKSYVVRSADEQVGDTVVANIVHPVAKGDIPVSLKVGAPQSDGSGHYKVAVDVSFPAAAVTTLPDGDKVAGGFTVYIAAGTPLGALSPVSKRPEVFRVPPLTQKAMVAQNYPLVLHAQVLIGKGENILSVAVVDQISGTAGFTRTTVVAQ